MAALGVVLNIASFHGKHRMHQKDKASRKLALKADIEQWACYGPSHMGLDHSHTSLEQAIHIVAVWDKGKAGEAGSTAGSTQNHVHT